MIDDPGVFVLVDNDEAIGWYLDLWKNERWEDESYIPLVFETPETDYDWDMSDFEGEGDIIVLGFDKVPTMYAEQFLWRLVRVAREKNVSVILTGNKFTAAMGIALAWPGNRGAEARIHVE